MKPAVKTCYEAVVKILAEASRRLSLHDYRELLDEVSVEVEARAEAAATDFNGE